VWGLSHSKGGIPTEFVRLPHIRNNDESSCRSVGQGHLEEGFFSFNHECDTLLLSFALGILYAITDMWIFFQEIGSEFVLHVIVYVMHMTNETNAQKEFAFAWILFHAIQTCFERYTNPLLVGR
jgi:hypothetical protein